MADQSDLVEHRFIYAGKRLNAKGTLVPAWVPEGDDPEDGVRLFPKAKAHVIGGIYTIESNDTSYLPSSVTYTGDRADTEVTAALEARDRAAGVEHSRKALERNDARSSELKALCAPLRELVGKQVGWANRAALLSYINAEIARG